MKNTVLALLSGSFAAMLATSAFAADVAPAPAPAKNNTLSIEFSPEFSESGATAGQWADDYVKLGFSHSFDNNIVWGAAFQYGARATNDWEQAETTLGYKVKAGAFTLTPGLLLGYDFGQAPKINAGNAATPDGYYGLTLNGDYKLDDHWTWNVFSLRYRNAFDYTWITPKVATGVTYKIDGSSAIYTNIGYAWKDNGSGAGLQPDKLNVAVGYKFSF